MTDAAPAPKPFPPDWLRGLKLPYLVDKVQDLPEDFDGGDWRKLQDPHPELDPEELERFMKLVRDKW